MTNKPKSTSLFHLNDIPNSGKINTLIFNFFIVHVNNYFVRLFTLHFCNYLNAMINVIGVAKKESMCLARLSVGVYNSEITTNAEFILTVFMLAH